MRSNIYLIVRWQEQRGTISSSGCEGERGGSKEWKEGLCWNPPETKTSKEQPWEKWIRAVERKWKWSGQSWDGIIRASGWALFRWGWRRHHRRLESPPCQPGGCKRWPFFSLVCHLESFIIFCNSKRALANPLFIQTLVPIVLNVKTSPLTALKDFWIR